MRKISLSIKNDSNKADTITFNDFILDTVFKGLKTLKTLNDFKFILVNNIYNKLETTIRKSRQFHAFFKYAFLSNMNLIKLFIPHSNYSYNCFK